VGTSPVSDRSNSPQLKSHEPYLLAFSCLNFDKLAWAIYNHINSQSCFSSPHRTHTRHRTTADMKINKILCRTLIAAFSMMAYSKTVETWHLSKQSKPAVHPSIGMGNVCCKLMKFIYRKLHQ
jgi:hypothetical protein